MNSDLKVRTKDYALCVIRLFGELPKKTETQVMGRQVLRSGTSGEGSLQELEETGYWLELLSESGLVPEERLSAVKKETGELKGIFVSIVRNTKAKSRIPKR